MADAHAATGNPVNPDPPTRGPDARAQDDDGDSAAADDAAQPGIRGPRWRPGTLVRGHIPPQDLPFTLGDSACA